MRRRRPEQAERAGRCPGRARRVRWAASRAVGAGRVGRGAAAGARPVDGRGRTWEVGPPRRESSRRGLSHAAGRSPVDTGRVAGVALGVAAAARALYVLPRPARGQESPVVRRSEGLDAGTRSSKRDRPAGPSGRPACGVGPIARVTRPPAAAPSRLPGPETAGRRPRPRPAGSRRDGGGRPPPGRRSPSGRRTRPRRGPSAPLPALPPTRGGFGLPNLRRNVCPHFYMTGSARSDPDPGAAPAQGADPPGRERLPLPAPRRGPPRAGLRQRRLPDAPLQPVRLLRGRSDARVTAAIRPAPRPKLMGPPTHLRRGAGGARGARPVRDPARPGPDPGAPPRAGRPAARAAWRARRGHERQGQRPRPRRLRGASRRAPGRRDAEAAPDLVPASGSRSTAGRSTRGRSPASSARPGRAPTVCRPGSARRPSSSC